MFDRLTPAARAVVAAGRRRGRPARRPARRHRPPAPRPAARPGDRRAGGRRPGDGAVRAALPRPRRALAAIGLDEPRPRRDRRDQPPQRPAADLGVPRGPAARLHDGRHREVPPHHPAAPAPRAPDARRARPGGGTPRRARRPTAPTSRRARTRHDPGPQWSGVVVTTWRVRDSNPRRRCQLIYSQPPLATRVTRRGCLPNERTPQGRTRVQRAGGRIATPGRC